jgi:hypothetical protein
MLAMRLIFGRKFPQAAITVQLANGEFTADD